MGFYGNIANNNKSTFTFDKTYSNRFEMDTACATDGIFVGRYVLVDYDKKGVDASVAGDVAESFNDTNNPSLYTDVTIGLSKYYDYDLTTIQTKSSLIPAWMIIQTDGTRTFHSAPSFSAPQFTYVEDASQKKSKLDLAKGDLILVLGRRSCQTSIRADLKWSPKTTFTQQELDEIENAQEADLTDIVRDATGAVVEHFIPEIWYCYGGTRQHKRIQLASGEVVDDYYSLANLRKDSREYVGEEDSNNDTIFNYNYATDARSYANIGRGWDSTVWQKTVRNVKKNNVETTETKYVMIAELNSVVPTFDISVDAPTETPLMPHYSTDTSNIYYKLHVQPSWGMRIKSWYKDFTIDNKLYPSDVSGAFIVDSRLRNGIESRLARRAVTDSNGNIVFDRNGNARIETYTPEIGQFANVVDDIDKSMPLAIYFNKAGFDPYKGTDSITDTIQKVGMENIDTITTRTSKGKLIPADSIAMRPSGTSNNSYNYHADNSGTILKENLPDTYELSIMLPSIGDTIKKVWDMVYGVNQCYDVNRRMLWHKETGEFAIEGDEDSYVRNTNYEWDTFNGRRMVYEDVDATGGDREARGHTNGILNYNKDNLNTITGCINSVHDLMGMIIRNYDELTLDNNNTSSERIKPKDWDPTKIYFVNGDYYRKHKEYVYNSNDLTEYKPIANMIDLDSGNYYREDWGQFPAFKTKDGNLDPNLTDVSEKKYVNYRKVYTKNYLDSLQDESLTYLTAEDYIDGAIYGTLIEPDTEVELNIEGYRPDAYYMKTTTGNIVSYRLDDAESPSLKSAHYYRITNVQPVEGKEFYVPNRYWAVNFDTGEAKFCIEETMAGAIPSDWSSNYKFYKAVTASSTSDPDSMGEDTEYVRDPNSRKLVTVPASVPSSTVYYRYDSSTKTLTIFDNQARIIETIVYDANLENISYDNLGRPISYEAPTYLVIGNSEGFASAWSAYVNNYRYIDESGNTVDLENREYYYSYSYKRREDIGGYFNININEASAINLIEFTQEEEEEHVYFYRDSSGAYISETAYDLKHTEYGRARNTLDSEGRLSYYKIEAEPIPLYYDLSAGYYYKNAVGDWCREVLTKTASVVMNYYHTPEFTPLSENDRVFIPGKYYYDNNGEKSLAWTYDSNTTYYEKVGPYVVSDTENIYPRGSLWTGNTSEVPESVTLGSKSVTWSAEKIDGFATNLFTLHGLILKASQILEEKDIDTRDRTTIQGTINSLNDLIDHFNKLEPAEIVMIDTYGRIHSGDNDTIQSGTYRNIGQNTTGTLQSQNNRWLKITTSGGDSPTYKPHLKIEHMFNQVSNTTTVSDKNSSVGNGLNVGKGDSLQLYTPIVDSQGHIIGDNVETVTLPYGFKTIQLTNSASENDAVSTISENGQSATETQDTITFAASNKWIKLDNATEKTVKIGHLNVHDNSFSKGDSVDQTPAFGNSFKALSATVDQAGHITALEEHSITIPTGSLTQTEGINGASVITSVGFTPTTGAITTTYKNIGNLALTGYEQSSSINGMPAAADSINSAIGKISYILNNDTTQVNTRISNAIGALSTVYEPIGSADDVKNEIIGDENIDTSESITLHGVRKYVDSLEEKEFGDSSDPNVSTYTLSEMVAKINELEQRLAALENENEGE